MKFLDNWATKRVKDLFERKAYNLKDPNNFQKAFDDYFSLTTDANNYVGAVFSAIDTWGWYYSKAKFRVYNKKKGGKSGIEEIYDHRTLFDKPNPYQVWNELAYMIAGQQGLFGQAFLFKKRRNGTPESSKGDVIGYQLLLPSLVQVKSDKGLPISHYVYRDGDKEVNIHRDNIIFIRYPNPNGGYEGYPIVKSVADQSEVNKLQMAYAKKFFEQGGFLGLAFSTNQQMSKSNFARTLDMLQQRYSGIENAYEIGVFDSGLQPVKAAYSLKDMDFGANRTLTREDIFSAFKVPKILVGMGESVNRATAEASIYQFTSGVIDPALSLIDAVLTKDFQMEFGDNIVVTHDTLAPRDQEGKLSYYSNGLKEGWLTINEVREDEGWNKLVGELGDIATINVGGALISVATGKQLAVEGQDEKQNVDQNDGNSDEDTEKSIQLKRSNEDLLWKKFDRRHELASRKFGKNIFNYVDGQQRRILEAVKDNFLVEGIFNLEEENMILFQLLEIDLWDIMREGYKYGAFQYGGSPSQFNQEVMAGQFNQLVKSALSFNDTTLKDINNTQDMTELKKVTNKMIDRSDALVTTSVTGSLNAGLLRSMIDAGLTKKSWLTMRDGRVRTPKGTHLEDHVSMDGVTIDIDETFKLKNRAGGLDECMYPGDPSLSLENLINDRCTIVGRE